jgi:hypothetical protein
MWKSEAWKFLWQERCAHAPRQSIISLVRSRGGILGYTGGLARKGRKQGALH